MKFQFYIGLIAGLLVSLVYYKVYDFKQVEGESFLVEQQATNALKINFNKINSVLKKDKIIKKENDLKKLDSFLGYKNAVKNKIDSKTPEELSDEYSYAKLQKAHDLAEKKFIKKHIDSRVEKVPYDDRRPYIDGLTLDLYSMIDEGDQWAYEFDFKFEGRPLKAVILTNFY